MKIWFQNRRARERREREIVEAMHIEKSPESCEDKIKSEVIGTGSLAGTKNTEAIHYATNLPSVAPTLPMDYNFTIRPVSIFHTVNLNDRNPRQQ